MEFKKAFELLKQGKKVKLPSWNGYWKWEDNTIKMYCKDGRIIPITESEDVEYTLSNILDDNWEAVDDDYEIGELVTTFTFGEALRYLKSGKRVARKGWNGKGIFIELQVPDEHSKMTHPYIYIDTTGLDTTNPDAPKDRVPWLASQTDMLSNDWVIVE